jgi:hypothetical protein
VRIVDLYGDHAVKSRFMRCCPAAGEVDIDPLRTWTDSRRPSRRGCRSAWTPTAPGSALGVPTLLLPFQADWRWEHGREAPPWYASLRLLWQQQPGPMHGPASCNAPASSLRAWTGRERRCCQAALLRRLRGMPL